MVRQSFLSIAVVAVIFFTAPVAAQGDQLVIDNVDQAAASAGVRPNRGMSMETVETNWGAPAVKRNAVGDPPISRWEYPNFVVYFEYRNVIHSVRTTP